MLGDKSKISGLDSATKSNLEGPTQEEQDEIESSYRAAEYYCMLATAIAGGVESPLQFIFQVIITNKKGNSLKYIDLYMTSISSNYLN